MTRKKRGKEYLWTAEPDIYPCIDCGAPCARLHIKGEAIYLDPDTKRVGAKKELRLALEHKCSAPLKKR